MVEPWQRTVTLVGPTADVHQRCINLFGVPPIEPWQRRVLVASGEPWQCLRATGAYGEPWQRLDR